MAGDIRRHRREVLQSGLAAVGASVALAGCSGDGDGQQTDGGDSGGTTTPTGTTASSAGSREVTVGPIPVYTHAAFYVADQMGFYDEYDLDVTLQNQNNTVNVVSFTTQGELDGGGGGPGASALNAINSDLPLSVVAPLHEMPEGDRGPDRLIARARDDDIESVADLEGKTVAVLDLGSTSSWHVSVSLQEAGLSLDDVDVRSMPFPDMIPALENEGIDAGHLPDPLGVVADNNVEGGVNALDQNLNAGALATTLFFNSEWASNNESTAVDFTKAYMKAARELHENWQSEEILGIISEYMDVPMGPLQASAAPYIDPNLQIPEDDLQAIQDFFIRRGEVDFDEPMAFDTVTDATYVEAALDDLGEV